jgi:predicted transposase/invertase (TIGR01784 family)
MLNEIFKYYFEFDLDKYHLTSEELTVVNKNDIKNRVDLLLTIDDENYFLNIEANIGNKDYYSNRNLIYQSKIVLYIFRKTSDYKKNFKIIQININDIKCPIDDEIISSTMTMYDTRNDIKDERIITHNLYLGKFKKLTYNKLNEMEKNLAMLVCNDKHMMEELAKGNELRSKIMSDYKKKISDEEFIEALFDPEWDKQMIKNSERKEGFEEGMMQGIEQGIEQGLEEGSLDKAIEIAKNMINKNIPLEDISEITGLSLEDIEKLK